MAQDFIAITSQILLNAWLGFVNFIPRLIGALIIFLIGWVVAVLLEKGVKRILILLKFNQLFDAFGWQEALEKAQIRLNPAEFIGTIFKWIVVLLFLLIAVEVLGFVQFTTFLRDVVGWLPNLLVAVAIFIFAAVAADFLGKITIASLERTKVGYSALGGKIVRWSVWIFALLAILFQLGVARPLIETLFTGIIAGFAIAFGVAFGLGGKEIASDFLQNLREKLSKKA